jgi:simple sugar transport system ATP-binding protein
VDVGAVEFLRNAILDQRAEGTGVVLLSENLDEVFELADRILVISDGHIVAETTPAEADPETVGLWMGGEIETDYERTTLGESENAAARPDGGEQ